MREKTFLLNGFSRPWALSAIALVASLAWGCKHVPTDAEGIRTGITQHLAGLKTLNISAMDLDINNVAMQANQAHVQVTFHPKTGAPPGAGMQVAYLMEKRDSQWVVLKTEGVGGGIEHPTTTANPHVQTGQREVHGGVPNFRELLPSDAASVGAPATGSTLPPGHPPIDTAAKTKPENPDKPN